MFISNLPGSVPRGTLYVNGRSGLCTVQTAHLHGVPDLEELLLTFNTHWNPKKLTKQSTKARPHNQRTNALSRDENKELGKQMSVVFVCTEGPIGKDISTH